MTSSGASIPAEAVEKQRDRTNDVRTAIIALVAALLGSSIGAVATYKTTHDQIKSQSQQSQQEFVRSQRQLAFAKLLSDCARSLELNNALASLQVDAAPDRQNAKRKIIDSERHVQVDTANIQLIASTITTQDASDFVDELYKYTNLLMKRDAFIRPDKNRLELSRYQLRLIKVDNIEAGKIADEQYDFVTAARRDLTF